MNNKKLITDKDAFIRNTADFFHTLFNSALEQNRGYIEIRHFNPQAGQYFFSSETEAAEKALEICNAGMDAYFGVNTRDGKGGKKENTIYLNAFHTDVDYGPEHKKKSTHESYDDALRAIQNFILEPTLYFHTGGGFHCLWVLNNPIEISSYGLEQVESINKEICARIGADSGTQDISRMLRIPGTFNFKLENNPREVELISNSGKRYSYEDFCGLKRTEIHVDDNVNKISKKKSALDTKQVLNIAEIIDVNSLPVSGKIKKLILHGNDGTYMSRSEADMAVITALIHKGLGEAAIKSIFLGHKIGEKYRSHSDPNAYLNHTFESAKKQSNLTQEQLEDPLFVSGSIKKDEKSSYHLDIIKFQEFMVKKYSMAIMDNAFFKYNGKCYASIDDNILNNICQKELAAYRKLFTKGSYKDFIHYAIGDALFDNEKAHQDQVNYLTLQNGLFSLTDEKMIGHTPSIFTTNLLPYEYDPTAQCPRFIKYLDEVFLEDKEKIFFVQEAVGYGFHKAVPMPTVFFLIGSGSNGKSVFINTITNLFGEENTCSISFNALSNEYYILGLFGKLINISSETPQRRQVNTDIIKAVVAGDWVTGRIPYKQPVKFKPFAKHYLAMNELPSIMDQSHGMWRRIQPVEFPRVFSKKEMDVDLTDKLKDELSGIFNWAIEGYKRLRSNNFRFTESRSVTASKNKYRNDSNNVLAFATDCLTKSIPGDGIKFSEVYEMYKTYCGNENIPNPYNKNQFRNILIEEGWKIEKSTKHSNQVYMFGVRVN